MKSSARLFVSIEVPEEIKQKLLALRGELPISQATLAQAHCTLCFIGETPGAQVDELIAKLSPVNFKPFQVTVQGIGAFPSLQRPRVIWIGLRSPGLNQLAQKINTALNLPGEKFIGHCTLARLKPSDFSEKMRKTAKKHEKTIFGGFFVNSFELKQSALLHTGATHIVLKTFKSAVFV